MISDKENWLRALEFRGPEWIPCGIGISPLTWHVHREKLEDVCLRHPLIFKNFKRGSVDFDNFPPVYRKGEYFRDNWGCVWYNAVGGIEGMVVEHPLADWSALDTYRPPDPNRQSERGERDWDAIRKDVAERKKQGQLVVGDGERLFDPPTNRLSSPGSLWSARSPRTSWNMEPALFTSTPPAYLDPRGMGTGEQATQHATRTGCSSIPKTARSIAVFGTRRADGLVM
jgi:hypothetical protein